MISKMNAFEEYVYEKFVQEMRSWPTEVAHDIYVVVIYISFVDDDPRAAQLWLSYNTLSQWKSSVARASSEIEAKWNYAFWFNDALLVLCKQPYMNDFLTDVADVDWQGVGLRDAYLTFRAPRTSAAAINAVVDVCANVTQHLHGNGIVASVCGRSVPVVFEFCNDIDPCDYRLDRIRNSNPQGLTHEYEHCV